MSEREGYKAHSQVIAQHARSVGAEASIWNNTAYHLKEGKLDSLAFSALGERFARAYSALVDDYAWYAWRSGVILGKVEDALETTAKNYGHANAIAKDDIRRVGEQF